MGLVTGLLTLPLAPVRGVVWLAGVVALVAEQELAGEEGVHERLRALEEGLSSGGITRAEYEEAWEGLMQRLMAVDDRG